MTHRSKQSSDMQAALRDAFAALQAGCFAQARDAAAPWCAHASGALLHALGAAACGDRSAAATLAAIARANPAARHPVCDLVDLLRAHGRAVEAPPHVEAALQHAPGNPTLLALHGATHAEAGSPQDALDAFHQVTALRPDAASWSNLGKALAAVGRFDEAEAAFARIARPTPQIALNQGIARLKSGRLAEGWPLFRHRHALPGRAPPPPGPELTSLDGLEGRAIRLLHDEGFGDTLQFIRYAPLLAARGARIRLDVPPPLVRLLAPFGGPGPADAWLRIPDLPALFGTMLETIPASLPYLKADPALAALWATRLPPGQRIGLVWAGAARTHDAAAAATDRIRSIPRDRLAPLLATPGVTWVSLQLGQPPPPGVFDPMPHVRDFADTAAIIAALDIVVSVDTAVAHLAAAMGRTVLLLDRFDHCWRWVAGRLDSPWYPERIEIIRQPTPGDWDSVLGHAKSRIMGRNKMNAPSVIPSFRNSKQASEFVGL